MITKVIAKPQQIFDYSTNFVTIGVKSLKLQGNRFRLSRKKSQIIHWVEDKRFG